MACEPGSSNQDKDLPGTQVSVLHQEKEKPEELEEGEIQELVLENQRGNDVLVEERERKKKPSEEKQGEMGVRHGGRTQRQKRWNREERTPNLSPGIKRTHQGSSERPQKISKSADKWGKNSQTSFGKSRSKEYKNSQPTARNVSIQDTHRRKQTEQRRDNERIHNTAPKRPHSREDLPRAPPEKVARKIPLMKCDQKEKKENPIGYIALQNICQKEEKEEAMIDLIGIEKRFLALVNLEDEIRVDLLKLVINCLEIICKSKGRPTQANYLLEKTYKQLLRHHLQYFILNFLRSFTNAKEIEGVVEKLVFIFETMLHRMQDSVKFCIPMSQLQEVVKSFHESGKLSDELMKRVESTNQLLQNVRQHPSQSAATPPEDFHQMSIVPVDEDFRPGYKPFLRENIINAPYDDVPQYLDVQFRLLREDFIKTLRDGIKYLRRERSTNTHPQDDSRRYKQDVLVYKDVKILNPVCNKKGGVYRVGINLNRGNLKNVNWEKSKRLKFGALVCLSNDFFDTLYFGAVENRDSCHLRYGELEIRFENCDLNIMRDFIREKLSFQMIESEAYFESYRHNLTALQQIDAENLPFKEHIVHGQADILPPKYLFTGDNSDNTSEPRAEERGNPSTADANSVVSNQADSQSEKQMELTSMIEDKDNGMQDDITIQVTQLHQWPSKETLGLDDSQYLACQLALTKRFALIQGPPGTGKTYVGLKIAQVLFDNAEVWRGEVKSPILMVAYTNHALDQFLMGLKRTEGIVRVGGRSRIEELEKFNLKTLRRERSQVKRHHGRGRLQEKYNIWTKIKEIEGKCFPKEASQLIAHGNTSVFSVSALKNFMDERHHGNLINVEFMMQCCEENKKSDVDSVLLHWLGVNREKIERDNRKERNERYREMFSQRRDEDDGDDDDVVSVPIACYQNEAKNCEDLDKQLQKESKMAVDREQIVSDIFDLHKHERWDLYRLWRDRLVEKCQDRIYESQGLGYENEQKKLSDIEDEESYAILRQAKVIAMTTTCAARYHAILQIIGPKIVLVEEAAEVLEAHILTSISSGCEHLILIGDHQQLRPSCTVYELAKKYHLNISMFERLVNIGVPCVRLSVQHRMRPEIALLMKHIYENLTDHPSVSEYADIRGVKKNLFFLDHRNPEDTSEDTHSHLNEYEAKFLAKLCRYFIQQDYAPSEITILTPYLGQMFKIKEQLCDCLGEGEQNKKIRISTIDNFQGEENEIILLSLVRSNDENRVGFVNDINRACVALSRARKGLYVIGNFRALTAASEIWRNVVSSLKDKGQFGEALPLFCSSHEEEISIKEPEDFLKKVPRGGCVLPCQYRLKCGHCCYLPCHPTDPDHEMFKCMEPCERTIPGCDNNHKCENRCWEQCQPKCHHKVEKTLLCGHTRQDARCGDKPHKIKCIERCEKKLPCGHQCQAYCGEATCTRDCQELVKHTDWPCGHDVTIACSATPLDCKGPCSELDCGHECSGSCGACLQGRVHKRCNKKCERSLVCSHICQASCAVACPPCSERCETSCGHSTCKNQCGEPCTSCKYKCEWKCKHLECSRMCGEVCDRPRCDDHCNKFVVECQHKCRGLCSESCICVTCDREDIQEIFATEEFDDKSVRFIRLKDCRHIFEVSGLDRWMDMRSSGEGEENEAIQLKACPICKKPIRKTMRYTNVINERLADIERVKETILGDQTTLTSNKHQIMMNLNKYISCGIWRGDDRHKTECETLRTRVERCKTSYDLVVLENQVNLLLRCQELTEKLRKDTQTGNSKEKAEKVLDIFSVLKYLITKRIIGYRIAREIDDINLEITRQSVRFEAHNLIFELNDKEITIVPERKITLDEIINKLSQSTRTEEPELDSLLQKIKDIRSKYPIDQLTPEEKKSIVKAMKLKKGHWYKCPNGHIYAIGECGGANEKATCPECKSTIGGENHKLEEGNSVASEMDGAQYAAWSEQANMENYEIIDEV